MSKIRFTFQAFALLAFTLALTSLAQAQATRTWVSGVGDDVNPCSRTAPCKTFAGAISKTAAGGEIDVLDPGGFGTVTITKSMTINGTNGAGFGSILASGTNGVIVNDSATATPGTIKVKLINLDINGAGTTLGVDGIRILSARSVEVENVRIHNFSDDGIDIAPSGFNVLVSIKNTVISQCAGDGVGITPGGTVFATAIINNSRFEFCGNGLHAGDRTRVMMSNSTAQLNSVQAAGTQGAGAHVEGGNAIAHFDHCQFTQNVRGIRVGAGAANVRIGDCYITANDTSLDLAGGTVRSWGDNKIFENTVNNLPNGASLAPKN